jgi:hypothetical protein
MRSPKRSPRLAGTELSRRQVESRIGNCRCVITSPGARQSSAILVGCLRRLFLVEGDVTGMAEP